MKRFALTALTGIVFAGGMFAGLVEKEVAEVRGKAPITEAHALDNSSGGFCTGKVAAMCYPPECTDHKECPANNQCTGKKTCRRESTAQSHNTRELSCKMVTLCDSSKDASRAWDIGSSPVSEPGKVQSSTESPATQPFSYGRYTSYY